MTLRKDANQWLIYDEASVTASVRGLELMALMLTGKALENHPDIELRALGNVAGSVADARLRYMLGLMGQSSPTDEERIVGAHVVRILGYLEGDPKPAESLDDLWASVVWLDSHIRSSGVEGEGWYREVVRGVS